MPANTHDLLFPPSLSLVPLLDAQGNRIDQHWPVNRVFCIGRNYADHAREMGHDPTREPPFYFSKPASALKATPCEFPLPTFSSQVEHEIEVVIGLTQGGSRLSLDQASLAVGAIGLGLDMTCRDRQKEAKSLGRPWELAKGFDFSAPITPLQLLPYTEIRNRYNRFALSNNGRLVQQGEMATMIWSIPELISVISQQMALEQGDIIMTGTPAGVAPVHAGDRLVGCLDGFPIPLEVTVTEPRRD